MLLLVARADAEGPLGEVARAAQRGKLFKDNGLFAQVRGLGGCGNAAQSPTDDDEIGADVLRGKGRKRQKAAGKQRGRRACQKVSALHGVCELLWKSRS